MGIPTSRKKLKKVVDKSKTAWYYNKAAREGDTETKPFKGQRKREMDLEK